MQRFKHTLKSEITPMSQLKNLIHGRETYISDFGSDFVMKRPLPTFGPDACQTWLTKQHRTKQAID